MRKLTFLYIMLVLINCNSNEVKNNFKSWNEYLGDKSRSHYSSLNQVNTNNVKSLKKIWEYKSGGILNSKNTTQIQCSPIVIDTILYGTNPLTKLFAIHAKTGKKNMGI